MLRIALIAGSYQPNYCGVAHYTACLREALLERKVESVVLTTHAAAQEANNSSVLGVVRDWHWTELIILVRAIQAIEVDCLHIQHAAGTYGFDRAIFLLPLLLKLAGYRTPIVTTVHEYGWWEWEPRFLPPQLLEGLKTWGQQQGWWDREDGFLLTQSEAIITTNRDADRIIYERSPHLKPRVYRIGIGANITVVPSDRLEARKKLQHESKWPQEALIVVFFGFLHPVKGLKTLLNAFKQVSSQQPKARLLLIGGVESLALRDSEASHYWNQLEKTIAQLELNEVVRMTGYLEADAVSRCLAGADIGVLPFNHGVTLKSGSLLTLMSHALPVIATRHDPPDLDLEDESSICFIPPRSADHLVTELVKLLSDADLSSQLGEAGRNFSHQFTWSSIATAHLHVYHVLTSHSRSIA